MAGCWKPAFGRIKPSGVPVKWSPGMWKFGAVLLIYIRSIKITCNCVCCVLWICQLKLQKSSCLRPWLDRCGIEAAGAAAVTGCVTAGELCSLVPSSCAGSDLLSRLRGEWSQCEWWCSCATKIGKWMLNRGFIVFLILGKKTALCSQVLITSGYRWIRPFKRLTITM